jgi:glycosyltransferase involved in cell wall biosynthesis
MLNAIGRRVPDPGRPAFKPSGEFKRVLHVGTELSAVGGLTRMISRWISADPERTNSLVLTQPREAVPAHLREAVTRSGGAIHRLNRTIGNQLDWVRQLRALARRHDLVILHIHCEDVIPLIAFADPQGLPPVVLLNHADHIFWLGTGASHLVISLRDAAVDICIDRRGVEPRRNFLLPTIVDPTVRTRARREAKLALGLDPDGVLLVSVARNAKYRSLNGVSFADMHAEVLARHPEAQLVVVGSGDPDDWQAAKARTGGRITGLPEQPDPSAYFEAADIYVDSYPFVSSTSMMEAGSYGTPLLTLFTAPHEARIFGINHVGLVGTALQAASRDEYDAILERLIVDADFRAEAGEAARAAIEDRHTPPGWRTDLEAAYALARELPPLSAPDAEADARFGRPRFGPPDSLHQDIFGYDYSVVEIRKLYMGALPAGQRFAQWRRMRAAGEIHGVAESLRLLLPEWLKRRLQA